MEPERNESSQEQSDDAREVHERLALPLLVPAGAFLFAVLVVYGLSRIYLELTSVEVGEVNMATPLALGVALAILGVSWYLASRPRVPRWQIAAIVALAVVLLTGGAIWAAVHEEGEAEQVVASGETPAADGGPVTPGSIRVDLVDPDFAVNVEPASAPADALTFSVTNSGALIHNFRVIKTESAPDALPLDESGLAVDEEQVDVVASLAEFPSGETEELGVELEAGSYVLICNVPTHYEAGMRTAFTVE